MADFDNTFENEVVESSDSLAKDAANKTVVSTADIIQKPSEIKNTIKNVKEISGNVKDAAKAAKETAKATKDTAKAVKDTAKTTKDAVKTGAEAAKTGVEAAEAGVDAALGVGTAGIGLAVKKGVELGIEIKVGEKKEKIEKLNKISRLAKSQDVDEAAQNIAEDVHEKAKKKRKDMMHPVKTAIKKANKSAKRKKLIIIIPLIVIGFLLISTFSFLFTGNSIAISSLNYSLGDKEQMDSYRLLALTEFVEFDKTTGNVHFKTGIEEDDSFLEKADKSRQFTVKVAKKVWERMKDNFITNINKMVSGAKEKLGINMRSETEIMQEEIDAIAQRQDYSSMVNLYADYMDRYMEKALDEQRNEVASVSRKNGYDEELTRAAFESCGNPFSNVDYCALLSAYSVKEYDLSNNSLYKFKSNMEDAQKKMLTVTYTDAYQKHIIPLPVYVYEEEKKNVSPLTYALYYGDNSTEVRWQVAYSLKKEADIEREKSADNDDDIKWHKDKVKYFTNMRKDLQKAYDLHKFFGSDKASEYKELVDKCDYLINYYNLKLLGLYNNRNEFDLTAFFLEQRANNVLSGAEDAHITDIKYYSQDSFDIVMYKIAEDSSQPDGKKVQHYIEVEEGEDVPTYEGLWFMPGYYKYLGIQRQKPEVEYIKYGQPTMHPFKSTDVFYLFDINPDEKFPYSLGTGADEVTYQQQYDIEYQELDSLVDLKRHKFVNVGAGHACTLTKEQIQHYLDLMPADTSANRKQLCKTAMGLTGAISYQMGGNSDCIGWDDSWWQPTGNDKYPYTGLDCSHFVRWAYHTAFTDDPIWQSFTYTGTEIQASDQISESELKPGDLGFNNSSMASGGDNHVGIFICYDEAGRQIWCHCGGKAHTVNTENRSFNVYYRPRCNSLEGSNYWNDEIILYGSAAASNFSQDEQYIMVQVMLQECSTDDAGKRAVAEASSNYAERHNATLFAVLTNQVHINYVSAYKDLFEKHTHNVREATQTDYDILNEAAAGVRIIFPREVYDNNRVTQWCSRGYTNSDFAKWQFVKTVGDNDFYFGD